VPVATQLDWTESTTLVKGPRGTYSINSQPAQVKAVCKEAILNFEIELVFHGCFPVLAERLRISKAAVIKAASDLGYREILARINKDLIFCSAIISMVCIQAL
jgi:hypothetical protein